MTTLHFCFPVIIVSDEPILPKEKLQISELVSHLQYIIIFIILPEVDN